MDKIRIENFVLRCVIGVNPEERDILQEVNVNLELHCDLNDAGQSDDILYTVDYKKLKQEIRSFVENSNFRLIEALAEGIAGFCLEPERVNAVTVKVDKPGALRFAQNVSVEITRSCP